MLTTLILSAVALLLGIFTALYGWRGSNKTGDIASGAVHVIAFVAGVALACASFGGLMVAGAAMAFAAEVPVPSTVVDLTEILSYSAEILITCLLALAGAGLRALLRYLRLRTGIEVDAETRRYLDDALFKAASYARLAVLDRIKAGQPVVDVRSELLSIAANYAIDTVPDALERFGIDDARLRLMIEARLGALFGDPDTLDQPPEVLQGMAPAGA